MGVFEATRRMGAMLLCALALVGGASAADTPAPATPAAATRLEDYHLLALSASEGVAVLRAPDRQLITLKLGATLPTARARLTQVLGDRLRFETADDKGVRQTAWMIRTGGPGQLPEVQRVNSLGPVNPLATGAAQTLKTPLTGSPASK